MTKPAELFACLYAKEFPAQALLRLRPGLLDKPCVVMEGEAPFEQVCSLTRKARLLGLSRSMKRVEVETFPSVTVLPRCQREETGTKTVLLECAGGFSPRVEDRSEDGAFLCVIDIAGTGRLFGQPEALSKNLLTRVQSLGVTGYVAVSHNFHAAIALVKGMPLRKTVKVILPGEEMTALASLPLAVLDLPEEHAEIFASWGIRTLGMLAALPEKELVARIGQSGKQLLQLARGEMPHLFQPVEPAFTLEECMELDSPVELLDALLFVVNAMLEQLILRAKARVLALASVSIVLKLEDEREHTSTVRPAQPTNEKQIWLKLLQLDLEAHPPQAAILALSLTAEPGSASKVQLGLFSPQLPEPARLDVTLARIRAIVGDGNAGCAVLQDTHQPGEFRMEPFVVSVGSSSVIPASQSRSAMRRLRPEEAISVTVQGQRPKAFIFREKHYVIEQSYGPWLTSGDWWKPTLWGFEQWDIVARAHDSALLCCCLVRERIEDSWQMAALYD
ncbi:DNA polymerase Y family protein [Edaphobacter aggregans]|uniref:DNA polymerase Y family protein n=1 Tax=Edaphobacter aggregans TaxID=570835 RepID=UPI000550429E|nr:DNA polymerase Y family protein [Edaphobacter aggregans]